MKHRQILVFAVVLLGILLRTHQISYNFDGDELFSVQAASGSFSQLLAMSVQDRTHPPLHLFVLYCWIKVWGSSETSTRLLSVVASLFFLLLVTSIARRWMKDWPALFVLTLSAVSPFFVYFGQQARPYSFIALFSSLTVVLFLKAHEDPSRKTWEVAYGFACAALMYSQYVGALLLMPQFAFTIFSKSPRRRGLLVWGMAGMFAILPWVLMLGRDLVPGQGKLETNIGWIPRPTLFSLFSYYVWLFGWLPLHGSTRILLLLSIVGLSSLALRYKSIDRRVFFFILTLALLQPLVLFVFSVFGPLSVWATRQVIGSAVFLFCLLGLALGLHRRPIGIALGVVLIGWCGLGLQDAFPEHSKPPWRSVASLVDAKCAGCDVVGAEKWISYPLGHYAKTTVDDFPGYGSRVGQADRVMFLCRPARCETFRSFSPFYKTTGQNRITWSLVSSSETEMVDVYFLEKTQAIHNP